MKSKSTWLCAFVVALASIIQVWPEAMLHAWLLLPEDLKSTLPPNVVKWFSYVLVVTSFLGKTYAIRRNRNAQKAQADESIPE